MFGSFPEFLRERSTTLLEKVEAYDVAHETTDDGRRRYWFGLNTQRLVDLQKRNPLVEELVREVMLAAPAHLLNRSDPLRWTVLDTPVGLMLNTIYAPSRTANFTLVDIILREALKEEALAYAVHNKTFMIVPPSSFPTNPTGALRFPEEE